MNNSVFSKIVKPEYIDCILYADLMNNQSKVSIDSETEVITTPSQKVIINEKNDSIFGQLSTLLLKYSGPLYFAEFLQPEETHEILGQFNILNDNNCFGLMINEKSFGYRRNFTPSIRTGIIAIIFSAKIFVFSFKGNSYDFLTVLNSSAFSLEVYRREIEERIVVQDKTKRPTEYYTEHYNPYPNRYLKKSDWEQVNSNGTRRMAGGLKPENNKLCFLYEICECKLHICDYEIKLQINNDNISFQENYLLAAKLDELFNTYSLNTLEESQSEEDQNDIYNKALERYNSLFSEPKSYIAKHKKMPFNFDAKKIIIAIVAILVILFIFIVSPNLTSNIKNKITNGIWSDSSKFDYKAELLNYIKDNGTFDNDCYRVFYSPENSKISYALEFYPTKRMAGNTSYDFMCACRFTPDENQNYKECFGAVLFNANDFESAMYEGQINLISDEKTFIHFNKVKLNDFPALEYGETIFDNSLDIANAKLYKEKCWACINAAVQATDEILKSISTDYNLW